MLGWFQRFIQSQVDEYRENQRTMLKARGGLSWGCYLITPINTLLVLFSAIPVMGIEFITHVWSRSNFTVIGKLIMIPSLTVTLAIINFMVFAFICESLIFPKITALNEPLNSHTGEDQPFHLLTAKVLISTVTTIAMLILWALINRLFDNV